MNLPVGRECPRCHGVDTQQVTGALWTCWDCGDEFDAGYKRSAAPGAVQTDPPTSDAEPGAAPIPRREVPSC